MYSVLRLINTFRPSENVIGGGWLKFRPQPEDQELFANFEGIWNLLKPQVLSKIRRVTNQNSQTRSVLSSLQGWCLEHNFCLNESRIHEWFWLWDKELPHCDWSTSITITKKIPFLISKFFRVYWKLQTAEQSIAKIRKSVDPLVETLAHKNVQNKRISTRFQKLTGNFFKAPGISSHP